MSSDLTYSDQESFFDDSNDHQAISSNESPEVLVNRGQFFDFPIQGDGINPMVDACENLIALILRIRSLKYLDNVDALHKSVINEVEKVELRLRNSRNYDDASLLTCRYCLCTAVDEAVLSTDWGKNSLWSSHSLLSTFHGETWGGEKFYKIIERLLESPDNYKDLLGLIYVFLCLGYQGRYGLTDSDNKERRRVIETIHSLLLIDKRKLSEFSLNIGGENTVTKGYIHKLAIPAWLIYLFGILMLCFLYLTFDHFLDIEIENISQKLKKFI